MSGVKLLMAGLNKHFSNAAGSQPVSFGGVTYALADLTQRLQSFVDLCDRVDTAKAAYQEQLNEADTQKPALRPLISGCKAFVRVHFGNSPGVLVDFGLAPRKVPAPRTVEDKAVAVEKGLATRKARHTMGRSQKKQVKGAVATAPDPASAGSTPVAPGPVASAPSQGTTAGSTPRATSA